MKFGNDVVIKATCWSQKPHPVTNSDTHKYQTIVTESFKMVFVLLSCSIFVQTVVRILHFTQVVFLPTGLGATQFPHVRWLEWLYGIQQSEAFTNSRRSENQLMRCMSIKNWAKRAETARDCKRICTRLFTCLPVTYSGRMEYALPHYQFMNYKCVGPPKHTFLTFFLAEQRKDYCGTCKVTLGRDNIYGERKWNHK